MKKLLEITRKLWFLDLGKDEFLLQRRQFLTRKIQLAAVAPIVASALVWQMQPVRAQSKRIAVSESSLTVAQIVDMSLSQQDISKDFLTGSRAMWQDTNTRGGIRGRNITHLAIEVDGSSQSIQAAWNQVHNNTSCVVMSGCTADSLSGQINAMMRTSKLGMANVAPWQQNSSVEIAPHTFTIFSNREAQIAHALKSLSSMNIDNLAVVYASQEERQQNQADIRRIANKLSLRLQEFTLLSDLVQPEQIIKANISTIALFIGGTPELAQFKQTLDRQSRQRYVIALADVNLQVLQQMSSTRNTPVIVTQVVPLASTALAIVRDYRQVLTQFYDEPPTSMSLAGYIAARYTCEVMQTVDGPLNRASVLKAFASRQNMDIGGFRVAFEAQRRTSVYVTQSMLSVDGRVIG